MTSENLLIK